MSSRIEQRRLATRGKWRLPFFVTNFSEVKNAYSNLANKTKKKHKKKKKTATTKNKTKKQTKNKNKTLGIWWAIKRKRRNTVLFVIDASTYNSSGYASDSWSTAGS